MGILIAIKPYKSFVFVPMCELKRVQSEIMFNGFEKSLKDFSIDKALSIERLPN